MLSVLSQTPVDEMRFAENILPAKRTLKLNQNGHKVEKWQSTPSCPIIISRHIVNVPGTAVERSDDNVCECERKTELEVYYIMNGITEIKIICNSSYQLVKSHNFKRIFLKPDHDCF